MLSTGNCLGINLVLRFHENILVTKMSSNSTHTTAFTLSLIGGLIIVAGSLIETILLTFGSYAGTYYGMGAGMMSGYDFYGYGSGWMTIFTLIALVFGIIVVIGAFLLNARPTEHMTWGIIILVFSLASFMGMGGYFIGAVLGLAGGAIALSYRASTIAKKE